MGIARLSFILTFGRMTIYSGINYGCNDQNGGGLTHAGVHLCGQQPALQRLDLVLGAVRRRHLLAQRSGLGAGSS